MAPDFSALLAAIGPDRLREHLVERRLLHVPAPAESLLEGMPVLNELDAALAQERVREGELSVYSATTKIDLAKMRMIEGGHVSPGRIASLPRDEMVFVFSDLARILPRLAPFVRQAQAELGESIQFGAIASWGCGPGLPPHYDTESLILVQLGGAKRWRFYGAPAEGAGRKKRSDAPVDLPVSAELTMHPGDLLFVPAGLRHQCESDGHSLHLGIGIQHDTGVALAERLLWLARDDAPLNAALMRAGGTGRMAEATQAYRERLHALIDTIDVAELFDRRLDQRVRKQNGEAG